MTKLLMVSKQQNPENDCDEADEIPGRIILPAKILGSGAGYTLEKKGNSWFVISDIPTDLSIPVEEITFYTHKYALLSKSGYIGRADIQFTSSNSGSGIKLDNFPGGPATFEVIMKFCYGFPIDLSPNNVASLRCASEFLEMTEEFEDGNLIAKTEAFLTFIVFASWRDSIIVLKTCENLSPWAENLQIIRRCCDSISWKVVQEKKATSAVDSDEAWWFDDVASLRITYFIRIIAALKAKGTKPEILGSCIMHYAEKWLPSMDKEGQGQRGHWYKKNELHTSIISGGNQKGNTVQYKEQKMILENLISILPPQKEAVPCKFLLWLLKMAIIYSVTPALLSELEKRAGSVLHDANVQDLLIPTHGNRDQDKRINSPEERTMHNIDTVQRILEYFLMHEQQHQQQQQMLEKLDVGKLLDNYLAEIAKDPHLTIFRFQVLAEALPENARTCHDGLYRAIDTYLKTHPSLSEHQRKRLCRIMNCQKLSLDACMHVAQNDRLPLKTVVQVLFSEQMKMRTAMQGKETISGDNGEDDENWSSTKREMKSLKIELEQVKEKMSELQRDYSELQREYLNLINKPKSISGWIIGWRKIKNASFFNGRIDAEDIGGQETPNPGGRRINPKRRISIP